MGLARAIAVVLLYLSIASGVALVGWDIAHGFAPMLLHQRGVAVALILIGASYAVIHASAPMRRGAKARAVSLGLAFILWGAEQFIIPGRGTTVIDCVLVCVFVVDLSLGVAARLKEMPTRR